MKVIVYVEGPSDELALEGLLRPLLKKANTAGVEITFIPITIPPGRLLKRYLESITTIIEGPSMLP